MSDVLRWILAIGVILILVAIFIVTFVLYRKTPVPKGCEEFEKPSKEKCNGCETKECHFNLYFNEENTEEKKL